MPKFGKRFTAGRNKTKFLNNNDTKNITHEEPIVQCFLLSINPLCRNSYIRDDIKGSMKDKKKFFLSYIDLLVSSLTIYIYIKDVYN